MMIEYTKTGALAALMDAAHRLTEQQYKTLRGQILAGDAIGAMRGLEKILRRLDGAKTE